MAHQQVADHDARSSSLMTHALGCQATPCLGSRYCLSWWCGGILKLMGLVGRGHMSILCQPGWALASKTIDVSPDFQRKSWQELIRSENLDTCAVLIHTHYIYIYTYIHTCIHTHIYIYTYIHIYIYVCVCAFAFSPLVHHFCGCAKFWHTSLLLFFYLHMHIHYSLLYMQVCLQNKQLHLLMFV